jgi:hypothetical protein
MGQLVDRKKKGVICSSTLDKLDFVVRILVGNKASAKCYTDKVCHNPKQWGLEREGFAHSPCAKKLNKNDSHANIFGIAIVAEEGLDLKSHLSNM